MSKKQKQSYLVAGPHNSGTTLLNTLLGEYLKPDIKYYHACDGYDGCEHTLSIMKLEHSRIENKNFIAPMHVRASPSLVKMIGHYNVKPIIITRNIYDCIVSLKERIKRYQHKEKASSALVFCHTLPIHKNLTNEQIEHFLIKFALPWYFSFYVSWKQAEATEIFVTYESLVNDKYGTMVKILNGLNIEVDEGRINEAIKNTEDMNTRKNVGIAGRGKELESAYKKEVAELINCYPMIDFKNLLG